MFTTTTPPEKKSFCPEIPADPGTVAICCTTISLDGLHHFSWPSRVDAEQSLKQTEPPGNSTVYQNPIGKDRLPTTIFRVGLASPQLLVEKGMVDVFCSKPTSRFSPNTHTPRKYSGVSYKFDKTYSPALFCPQTARWLKNPTFVCRPETSRVSVGRNVNVWRFLFFGVTLLYLKRWTPLFLAENEGDQRSKRLKIMYYTW